jgi:hypothetical protein
VCLDELDSVNMFFAFHQHALVTSFFGFGTVAANHLSRLDSKLLQHHEQQRVSELVAV